MAVSARPPRHSAVRSHGSQCAATTTLSCSNSAASESMWSRWSRTTAFGRQQNAIRGNGLQCWVVNASSSLDSKELTASLDVSFYHYTYTSDKLSKLSTDCHSRGLASATNYSPQNSARIFKNLASCGTAASELPIAMQSLQFTITITICGLFVL